VSDSKEPYTNLDLETAENLLIAAGKPELAKALGYHKDGVRNMIQGEWGNSFINSLNTLLKTHIGPLAEDVAGLRTEVATRLGKIETDLRGLNKRHGAQIKALAKDIAAIKEVIAQRPAQRIVEHEAQQQQTLELARRVMVLEDYNVRLEALEHAITALREQHAATEQSIHATD